MGPPFDAVLLAAGDVTCGSEPELGAAATAVGTTEPNMIGATTRAAPIAIRLRNRVTVASLPSVPALLSR